jgi:hypothetical protein
VRQRKAARHDRNAYSTQKEVEAHMFGDLETGIKVRLDALGLLGLAPHAHFHLSHLLFLSLQRLRRLLCIAHQPTAHKEIEI